MKSITKLVVTFGTVAATGVLAAAPAMAATSHAGASYSGPTGQGVVFVQNDDPAGNTIVAYDRTGSGGLAQAGSYRTGGAGGVLSGSVVDHLASEGSLAYDRSSRSLYAVNAGSNTLTSFRVAGDHLARQEVVSTGGQFPVSVTSHGNLVFVLNARDGGSISGYLRVGGALLPVPFWHRDLHLNTSAPGQADEFTSTPGQIGFTPDGRTLIVSTKNGGNTLDAFPIGLFGPSAQPVVTSLPGKVPFGFAFDASGHLVVSEAGTNSVATFNVSRNGHVAALDTAATGQAATCWIATIGNKVYASNAGSANLSRYTTSYSGALTAHGVTATDPGTVDAAASSDGRYLYAQTGAKGIVDSYRVQSDGSLAKTGSVTVPNAVGAEGIVAL
ncbi:lactonase family protein [Flexivirga alba]|uniref:Lactonase family protein n=1 Tax=Flexivirga alba TaxID=702742 RepID=A0ABW2ACC1_9MICO